MKQFIAKHSPLFILAGLCIAMALYSSDFSGRGNLQSVAMRTSVVGIIAVGELLVILTAGIDLSVGSVAALSAVVGCIVMKSMGDSAMALPVGLLVGCGVGMLCGLINGLLVSKGRIPPFIVTLGTMMWARGLVLLASNGEPVFGMPDAFFWLGGANAWWVPVLLTVSIVAFFFVVLTYTPFGRSLYAIGGNRQAARLSGLPVDRSQMLAYTLSGTLAGFAGLVLASRTSIAAPMAAEMYELEAIAACVIGGASLMGGEGGVIAALAGALIMTVLRNFCTLEDIQVYWQQVLVGGLIVILVYYDSMRKRKAGLIGD